MDRPRRPVELARRYDGGTLELKPSDPELKSKRAADR